MLLSWARTPAVLYGDEACGTNPMSRTWEGVLVSHPYWKPAWFPHL
jgi:hypothetical protein